MKRNIAYSARETFKISVNTWWMVVTLVFRWTVFVRTTAWVIKPSRHETAWEGTVHEVVYPNKIRHMGSKTF